MEPCVNLLECIDKGLKEKVDRIKIAVAYVKLSGVEKFSSLLKTLVNVLLLLHWISGLLN